MNYHDPNQQQQQQQPQFSQQHPNMQPRKTYVNGENVLQYMSKLPAAYQAEANKLQSLEEKVQFTQNLYDKHHMVQLQRRTGNPVNMQNPQAPPGQQRMHLQRMPPGQQPQQNMPFVGQQQLNFPRKIEPGMNPGNYRAKQEPGFQGQPMSQPFMNQPKHEPGFPQGPNFNPNEKQFQNHPQQQFYPQNSHTQNQQNMATQQQQHPQFADRLGPGNNQMHEQHQQQIQRPQGQGNQMPPQSNVPFPGPGPDSNDRQQKVLNTQTPQQQVFNNQPAPAMHLSQQHSNQNASQLPNQPQQHQSFQHLYAPNSQIRQQQRPNIAAPFPGPGQRQPISQHQNHLQQQQQGPQGVAFQQFPQVSQNQQQQFVGNVPAPVQAHSVPTQQHPVMTQQVAQPGLLHPPNSQGPPQGTPQGAQGPLSQQQNVSQGPSPAVQQSINSVGRVPTPSLRSNQSGGNIPPEVFQSAEYQAVLKELCSYQELCIRLHDRMKLDNDPKIINFSKILTIIEGKLQVPKELMAKLIKNIQTIATKYDITYGLSVAGKHLQRMPYVDLTKALEDSYSMYADKRLKAPKQLYNLTEMEKKQRRQRMYMKKRIKWISDKGVDFGEPLNHPFPTVSGQSVNYDMQQQSDEYNELGRENGSERVKFIEDYKDADDNHIQCIVRVEGDPPVRRVHRPDFYANADDGRTFLDADVTEEDKDETFKPADDEISYDEYFRRGIYMHPIVPCLGGDRNSLKREHGSGDGHPGLKKPKLINKVDPENTVIPGPAPHFAVPHGRPNLPTKEEPLDDSYEAYLRRQQDKHFNDPISMNTKLAQFDQAVKAAAMPVQMPSSYPDMDAQSPHLKDFCDDCPFNCCVPYHVDTLIGKAARLPQHAAKELRRFRHRADFELLPLSEHSQVFSVIINPSKMNSLNYPEIRLFIHRTYPTKPADYHIILPSTLHSKAVKSFYRKLEEKMEDRKMSGVPFTTITEIVSAFKVACDTVFRSRDILDNLSLSI